MLAWAPLWKLLGGLLAHCLVVPWAALELWRLQSLLLVRAPLWKLLGGLLLAHCLVVALELRRLESLRGLLLAHCRGSALELRLRSLLLVWAPFAWLFQLLLLPAG